MNGCGPSVCGPDIEQLKLLIKSIIFDLLNDNVLQAGLKDCNDKMLGKDRNVVVCEALADLICDLINEGKLCVPKIAGFTSDCDTKKLIITMADGTELVADASCFGGSGADGNTKIKSFDYVPDTGVATITDTEDREFPVTIKVVRNKAMGWDADKQEVSVTDTENNKVSTPVVFNNIEKPPVNQGAAPATFIGKSASLYLGEPATWLRMLLPNGQVGKVPVFFDDEVVSVGCPPVWYLQHPETGQEEALNISAKSLFKLGDSLQSYTDRKQQIPNFSISYRPNQVSASQWMQFAEQIRDWLRDNGEPNIDQVTDRYFIEAYPIGYLNLRNLLSLNDRGMYARGVYYHGYSADEVLQPYYGAYEMPMMLGSDGNVYDGPQAGCADAPEPTGETTEPFKISVTYRLKNDATTEQQLVTSKEKELSTDIARLARPNNRQESVYEDILSVAEQLRQDLLAELGHEVTWAIGVHSGKVAEIIAVNTPWGTIVFEDYFKYDYGSGTSTDYMALLVNQGQLKPGVKKLRFHKTDELTQETNQDNNLVLKTDAAKTNMLHIAAPERISDKFQIGFSPDIFEDALWQLYFPGY